jgi:ubiquinone/menaquinone biosynthesis C-methylase UbiE
MDKNEIIKFYSEYSSQFDEKIGCLDLYDISYSDFVLNSKRKGNMLDLACGPGNVSAFVKKMIPDVEITCVDLSEKMLQLAETKIKDAKFYVSDILCVEIPENKYDLIFCAFGIPYIKSTDLDRFVSQVSKFSKKGTSVYISCMEGTSVENEVMSFANYQTVSVQRHKKDNVVDSFRKFDFTLVDFQTQGYKEPDGSMTTDMIFFFEKE